MSHITTGTAFKLQPKLELYLAYHQFRRSQHLHILLYSLNPGLTVFSTQKITHLLLSDISVYNLLLSSISTEVIIFHYQNIPGNISIISFESLNFREFLLNLSQKIVKRYLKEIVDNIKIASCIQNYLLNMKQSQYDMGPLTLVRWPI